MLLALGAFWMALALMTVLVMLGKDASGHLWQVGRSAGAYFYLWWLGVVLFDLSYVWHYYFRRSKGVDTLRAWASGNTWPA